ncbi:YraN family protein [Novosphingopyxis sp. YJ-S2-01]|uniref:YraN family protein n=1 Tax=Novosphingopyxis sp. YJ-S2-01 TaxID=2794021 RepID=UPI0018DEBF37|nr:YraN family protein [Novosphingopyxis sp. YJ-S2-01]MBH9538227.1 YraN family protein [Novosphingopyxis sp. YJ-S2-01]
MNRRAAEARGRRAETIAAWWLRLHGYRILSQRVRNPRGEIDIVARRGGVVAFVEVKARASTQGLDSAIDDYRFRRVAAAAEVAIPHYCGERFDARFDIILVAPGRLPRHMRNVWHAR